MRMANVYNAGADANPNANHDPTTNSDLTLTLSLMLIINLTLTLPIFWLHRWRASRISKTGLWNECYSSN